jgi:membrane protease YdiL (CAAX protease family)
MSIRAFAMQRPVATAVACAALQFVLTILILQAGMAWLPEAAFGKVKLVAFASTILLPMVLAQVLGLWRRVGLAPAGTRPAFFFVSLLVCAPYLAMGVNPAARDSVAGEAAMQFFNAFGEELLFRGVIFALLLRLAPWKSIALSGVLFGAMHLIHGVMDGDWAAASHQALVTTAGGVLFAAVRQRTGSLWCAIFVHMLLNLAIIFSNIEPALGEAASDLVQRIAIGIQLALGAWVAWTASRPMAWDTRTAGLPARGD